MSSNSRVISSQARFCAEKSGCATAKTIIVTIQLIIIITFLLIIIATIIVLIIVTILLIKTSSSIHLNLVSMQKSLVDYWLRHIKNCHNHHPPPSYHRQHRISVQKSLVNYWLHHLDDNDHHLPPSHHHHHRRQHRDHRHHKQSRH